jgi:hypothetical protein
MRAVARSGNGIMTRQVHPPLDKWATHRVVVACEKFADAHDDDCSGFVKAVMTELKLDSVVGSLPHSGLANDIVDAFSRSPWHAIESAAIAERLAEDESKLVLGGRKEAGHGHVVIVVPGPLNRGKYPTAYWGSLDHPERSGKYATINWAWAADDRDSVSYAYVSLPGARRP